VLARAGASAVAGPEPRPGGRSVPAGGRNLSAHPSLGREARGGAGAGLPSGAVRAGRQCSRVPARALSLRPNLGLRTVRACRGRNLSARPILGREARGGAGAGLPSGVVRAGRQCSRVPARALSLRPSLGLADGSCLPGPQPVRPADSRTGGAWRGWCGPPVRRGSRWATVLARAGASAVAEAEPRRAARPAAARPVRRRGSGTAAWPRPRSARWRRPRGGSRSPSRRRRAAPRPPAGTGP
jgi:hypothetical protein